MTDIEIGRRQLVQTVGIAAAGGAIALACSSSDDKSSSGAATQQAAGSPVQAAGPKQPKRGGALTVDAGGEPQPNLLIYMFAGSNVYLRSGIWDNLVYLDHEGKLQPMLAETFEMRPDFTGVH